MRLAPRSLFGRLVAVLLAGLVVAQLVTLYINASERDQLLLRSGGMHVAQRIADLALLLDSMAPPERRTVAAVFDGPPLAVSLDRPPVPSGRADDDGDFRLAMFSATLRRGLGDDMPFTVAHTADAPPLPAGGRRFGPPPGAPGEHPRMGGPGRRTMGFDAPAGRGAAFVVQVRLRDGSLATFDSQLAPQAAAIPTRIALTLLASLIVVGALSLIAVRWVTVPLRTLAGAADELGRDLDRPPLPETGPVEVRQAAKAFNTMQQRLARFVADRTRIFTAMSHDLKTPITRLRLRAELLDDEALRARFVKDLDEMESMVTQTLDYMRDAGRGEPVQRIDVDAVLESVQKDCEETGGNVAIRGAAAAPYTGRPLALRRCVTNLVDNAVRYGGRATIVVDDAPGLLTLRIQDEGPGIPDAQLERAFEPFFRGEDSRSRDTGGTGLGLGIARNIARAHGGDVVLGNRPEGGLEATVTLPRDARVEHDAATARPVREAPGAASLRDVPRDAC